MVSKRVIHKINYISANKVEYVILFSSSLQEFDLRVDFNGSYIFYKAIKIKVIRIKAVKA